MDARVNEPVALALALPAGGWPDGSYHAAVKVTRDGQTLIEQATQPIPFE